MVCGRVPGPRHGSQIQQDPPELNVNKSLNILVAMSGGVDSALAAALLKGAGHRIHGLHFVLPSPDDVTRQRISRIRKIAEYLEIPLEIS